MQCHVHANDVSQQFDHYGKKSLATCHHHRHTETLNGREYMRGIELWLEQQVDPGIVFARYGDRTTKHRVVPCYADPAAESDSQRTKELDYGARTNGCRLIVANAIIPNTASGICGRGGEWCQARTTSVAWVD